MPTERGQYRCVLKEGASTPFLALEPTGQELPTIQGRGILIIDLRPGTTFEQAQALARELDKYMIGVAIID